MKVIVTPAEKPATNKYPYLGIHHICGKIILFTEPKTGVILIANGDSLYSIGDTSSDWVESSFTPLRRNNNPAKRLIHF